MKWTHTTHIELALVIILSICIYRSSIGGEIMSCWILTGRQHKGETMANDNQPRSRGAKESRNNMKTNKSTRSS